MTVGELYTLIHDGNEILEELDIATRFNNGPVEYSLTPYQIEKWTDVITDLITTIKDMEVITK